MDLPVGQIVEGHVLDEKVAVPSFPAKSVNCIATSPPYYGLRAYDTEPVVWGGRQDCEHSWQATLPRRNRSEKDATTEKQKSMKGSYYTAQGGQFCSLCGAWRGELGLEPTPELYIEHMMMVFDELKRVLRDDGICFVNIGDTYAGGKGQSGSASPEKQAQRVVRGETLTKSHSQVGGPKETRPSDGKIGITAKSLCLIPERFVLAMQQHGWIVRCKIVWAKGVSFGEHTCNHCGQQTQYSGSTMPDSAKDRPNKNGHETVYMFVKAKERKTDLIYRLPNRLSITDANWLAALVDGEGHIGIEKKRYKNGEKITYGVRLSVTNSNREILEKCKQITKVGYVGSSNSKKKIPQWRTVCANGASVIAEIYPHLIVKKEQAKIAITIQKLNDKNPRQQKGGRKTLNAAELEKRDKLYRLCKSLNQGEIYNSGLPEPNLNRYGGCNDYWYEQQYEEISESTNPKGKLLSSHKKQNQDYKYWTNTSNINPLGRTIRNVWCINPQAYKESHFATFPEKLVEPLIKMAVPEQVCKKCGLGRKKTYSLPKDKPTYSSWLKEQTHFGKYKGTHPSGHGIGMGSELSRYYQEVYGQATSPKIETGLTDCGCNKGWRPGVALDPFMGSGTVAVVAYELRRDYIGIELQADYVQLSRRRLAKHKDKFSLLERE